KRSRIWIWIKSWIIICQRLFRSQNSIILKNAYLTWFRARIVGGSNSNYISFVVNRYRKSKKGLETIFRSSHGISILLPRIQFIFEHFYLTEPHSQKIPYNYHVTN